MLITCVVILVVNENTTNATHYVAGPIRVNDIVLYTNTEEIL